MIPIYYLEITVIFYIYFLNSRIRIKSENTAIKINYCLGAPSPNFSAIRAINISF